MEEGGVKLMYRIISFIVIFTFVATTLHFYYDSRHDHSESEYESHEHNAEAYLIDISASHATHPTGSLSFKIR